MDGYQSTRKIEKEMNEQQGRAVVLRQSPIEWLRRKSRRKEQQQKGRCLKPKIRIPIDHSCALTYLPLLPPPPPHTPAAPQGESAGGGKQTASSCLGAVLGEAGLPAGVLTTCPDHTQRIPGTSSTLLHVVASFPSFDS